MVATLLINLWKHLCRFEEDELQVEGITKLHGTSSAVVKHIEEEISFQSRSRIITPQDDNSSFATLMSADAGMIAVRKMFAAIEAKAEQPLDGPIIVYGE